MLNFVRRWMPLAIAVSLLTACATANSDPACVCPPVKEYSKEIQRQLADEIENASQSAVFPLVLQDYELMRAQAKSCK